VKPLSCGPPVLQQENDSKRRVIWQEKSPNSMHIQYVSSRRARVLIFSFQALENRFSQNQIIRRQAPQARGLGFRREAIGSGWNGSQYNVCPGGKHEIPTSA
jgi:hypothetical protein